MQGGAFWLLDEIALAQRGQKRVAVEEFQIWKLTVKPDRTAILACEDGNGRTTCQVSADRQREPPLGGSPPSTKKLMETTMPTYTAEFRTDADYAYRAFKARSPQDALKQAEPPRVSGRLFGLGHAAMAGCSRMA